MKTSVIEKVKKLLAKAGSTDSPQEAEALFVAAQKLMVKHRIQQHELQEETDTLIEKHQIECFAKRLEGMWEVELASTIFWNNCVHYTWNKRATTLSIYGTEQDVQLVKYLFETTRTTFRRLAKSEYLRIRLETIHENFGNSYPENNSMYTEHLEKEGILAKKNQFIRSFLVGACKGLNYKIVRMTQEHVQQTGATSYSLVTKTALERAFNYVTQNVTTRSVNANIEAGNAQAYGAGVAIGRAHSMYIPVEQTSSASGAAKLLK